MTPTLDRRSLNRATLERQLLLRRSARPVLDVVEHLVGLQAQTPHTWYTGLWSRIEGFDPVRVGDLLLERGLVRIALMRSTIHLVTAADCKRLRPLLQPVMDRWLSTAFGKNLEGLDLAEAVAAARELLEEQPLTFAALGERLAERFPGYDTRSLAQMARGVIPLVQVPPRGVWGRSGAVAHTSAEAWLGDGEPPRMTIDDMVLRYLAAFGPASVMDVQTWSGLTRLGEVLDRLRPRLLRFRDAQGRELFDLPEAPRPDPDTPAPPRFLYDYDNVLLSHADRSRVITADLARQEYEPYGPIPQLILVDGFTRGDWTITRTKASATLTIRPWLELSPADEEALTDEATTFLAHAAPGAAERDVQFAPPRVPGTGEEAGIT